MALHYKYLIGTDPLLWTKDIRRCAAKAARSIANDIDADMLAPGRGRCMMVGTTAPCCSGGHLWDRLGGVVLVEDDGYTGDYLCSPPVGWPWSCNDGFVVGARTKDELTTKIRKWAAEVEAMP